MNKSILKSNKILSIMNNSLIKLPTPINISIWWNFGSLLGITLLLQIMSGLFLSMHYSANTEIAFNSMIHIIQDVNYGWMFRLIHMNGASMFFFCMYMHIGRNIYYGSYNLIKPWIIGVFIFMLSMATAFMGYVLPWGQMSFWGATVITNLVSTIPYIGQLTVEWIWGGFSVSNPTLNRFFTFHFILPFIILMMVMIHLLFIHETGSNNPLGINSNLNKIPFNIYFTLKDILGFMMMFSLLIMITLLNPFIFSDPENFLPANPMITPIHIQPEWYFLFAYTILRSIPNKLGGVIALLMSILILLIMPFVSNNKFMSLKFYPLNKLYFWFFFNNMMLLTWLGMKPVEPPFILVSQIMTIIYFSYFFMNPYLLKKYDFVIMNI
uniref:cytochrome b n=1 Tax=Gotra octocincta TaxID=3029099 RepID=UPI0023D8BFF4|nr:cytochrome b [Gotra octocincta]WDQ40362.1 cytochrome b [Gotra octocincta]